VQEFQFGMNWAVFSSFVGDVFGSPLAVEGLGAFMLESTFIGLWVFGRDRLSPRVHLLTIYMVWFGTWASAYLVIAANSFMQHPVGYQINSQTGRAEATDIWKILFQDKERGLLTALVRFAPGSVLDFHRHVDIEQTYVLEGTLEDAEGVCAAGDFVWRPKDNCHRATAPGGALLLAVFQTPNVFLEGPMAGKALVNA
jgi:quercetin dioxygenase-like cupin family protein